MTSQPTRTKAGDGPERPGGHGAPPDSGLQAGLKNRHLSMIAIGGVIGAGLFVGSSSGIATAGPGILGRALQRRRHARRARRRCGRRARRPCGPLRGQRLPTSFQAVGSRPIARAALRASPMRNGVRPAAIAAEADMPVARAR